VTYYQIIENNSEHRFHVAAFRDQWVAIFGFSAAALKCSPRDRWIGWSFRHQHDRLKWLTNNSRFLILPDWHLPNLASRILSLCEKRIADGWQARFGHPVLLLETFVDPQRFYGTIFTGPPNSRRAQGRRHRLPTVLAIAAAVLCGRQRTNEIKTVIPLLESIPIHGKTITTDALLPQRRIADYIVAREAH